MTIQCTRNVAAAFLRESRLKLSDALVDVTREKAEGIVRRFRAHYSAGTAWRYTSHLVALFRAFAAAGYLLENPFAWIGRIRKPHLPVGITLTAQEMHRLLEAPELKLPSGIRHRAILETMYSTGVRLGECAKLDLADVDLKEGTALVRRGKGGKDRVVPLGATAAGWIRKYLCEVRPRFAALEETALWVGQQGRRIAAIWIRLMIKKLARKAGIDKPVTPHTIRRTCATHLLARNASAWVVRELIGHGDGGRDVGRYLRVEPHELKKVHQERHPRG